MSDNTSPENKPPRSPKKNDTLVSKGSFHPPPMGYSLEERAELFAGIPLPCLVCDAELQVVYANSAAVEFAQDLAEEACDDLFGVAPLDFPKNASLDGVHPDPKKLRRFLADKKQEALEFSIEASGQSWSVRLSRIASEPGYVVHWSKEAASADGSAEDSVAQLRALSRVQAVIQFDLTGNILEANDNFCTAMGYRAEELVGRHHRLFVDSGYAQSEEYSRLWRELALGVPQVARFRRLAKGGREIWIEASYIPILDREGRPYKVVKFATDVTKAEQEAADYRGQIAAISRAQAVIEFDLQGNILGANENLLKAMGYRLDEVKGRHHSVFVDPEYARTAEYRTFWHELALGHLKAGRFRRMAKGGREVWLEASYNPIMAANGKPFKVVKYATDITASVSEERRNQLLAIVADASPPVVFGDTEGTIQYLNRSAVDALQPLEKHLPRRAAELVGQPFELFRPRDKLASGLPLLRLGTEALAVSTQEVRDSSRKVLGHLVTWEVVTKKMEIEASIRHTAQTLGTSAAELSATSDGMMQNASGTAARASGVAAASEEVSTNIQTVAAAVEEMSASIKEIARSAAEAAQVASQAVSSAERTNMTVLKLGESSADIGKVIKVITSIAQQTNLLALNATIEAARAGEAGKGFAVVANEVKELAKETAKATEDIGQRIEAIQGDTKGAVEAIAQIAEIINKISDIQNTIAGAVEEQSATTNEITRNVSEAAKGSGTITQNVTEVARAAQETTSGARATQEAAGSLATLAARLLSTIQ